MFVKSGVGAWAAGVLIRPTAGRATAVPYYKAVFDERFEESRAFAAGAAARRIPTAAIRGDITRLFFDDLDLRWKQGPLRLAGYTTPAAFFCLDLLARDRGMRARHCATKPSVEAVVRALDGVPPGRLVSVPPPSSDPSPLVFWIIEPSGRASA